MTGLIAYFKANESFRHFGFQSRNQNNSNVFSSFDSFTINNWNQSLGGGINYKGLTVEALANPISLALSVFERKPLADLFAEYRIDINNNFSFDIHGKINTHENYSTSIDYSSPTIMPEKGPIQERANNTNLLVPSGRSMPTNNYNEARIYRSSVGGGLGCEYKLNSYMQTHKFSTWVDYNRVTESKTNLDQHGFSIGDEEIIKYNEVRPGIGYKVIFHSDTRPASREITDPTFFAKASINALEPKNSMHVEVGLQAGFASKAIKPKRRGYQRKELFNERTHIEVGVNAGYKTSTVQSQFNDNRVNNPSLSISGEASYHGFNIGSEFNFVQPMISSPSASKVCAKSIDAQDGKIYAGYGITTNRFDVNFTGSSQWGGDPRPFEEEKNGVNVTLAGNQTRHKFHKLGVEMDAELKLHETKNSKISATFNGGYNKVNLESVHIDENKNEISTNNKYNEIPISAGFEYRKGKFSAFAKAGGDILNRFKEGLSGQFGISYKISSNKK